MLQAWSRHIVIVSVVAVAFGMLQKPLLTLLSFIESTCLASLSPNWFGAFVVFLVGYLLKREWDYRKIYVPRAVSLWLILLLGIYLYYRHWEGSFSFWTIPYFGKLAWPDLLLFPWGGAVAIALRSRSKEDYWAIGITLATLCALFYFILPKQGAPSLGWPLGSIAIAVDACLLMDVILYRWSCKLQPMSKEEDQRVMELSSQAIDPDDAIESEEDDWLGFSTMTRIVCENLQALGLSKGSLTVGIIAPWGRGKSSFINLLRKRLEKDGGILIPFNPRGSKSVSSIPEDFFDTFAKELSRHYLGFGLLLARYTKHLGLLNQYEWTRPLGSLLTLLLPGKEQEAVNRTLRELGKRVYVLLDDLDRLSGEEILEVLKLMDRNASFSNTVFITAYDKAYVKNVLKKHLDHGLNHSFIDKYISWEIPLPEPDKGTLKRLIGLALSRKIRAQDFHSYWDAQRGWDQVADIIIETLVSVRDLKRYLNLVIPRYNAVFSQVDLEDYFLLYLLYCKDLEVYIALYSGQILKLGTSKESYDLVPNFEEDLELISNWEGTKGILERLFPLKDEERGVGLSSTSLRSMSGFGFYFKGLEDEGCSPYSDVVSGILSSKKEGEACEAIDVAIKEQGIDRVINAFLYLVRSPKHIGEKRELTIALMAYVAISYSPKYSEVEILEMELLKLLSKDGYMMYKELGVVWDQAGYKRMLEQMVSLGIRIQPLEIADLISSFDLGDDAVFPYCIYTLDEVSKILLDCQRSYYSGWKPTDYGIEKALSFVSGKYACIDPPYTTQACKALISLIRRYPEGCFWMLVLREDKWGQIEAIGAHAEVESLFAWGYYSLSGEKTFSLSISVSLLKLLEEQGLSLDEWKELIKDLKYRYVLDYAMSMPGGESSRRIEHLPDEKADLHNIDYIYRAILAQEERDRQQAASEG